ncbi:MAG: hypothetical protein ACOYUZ_04290 [Patescibacteria group bacterium]
MNWIIRITSKIPAYFGIKDDFSSLSFKAFTGQNHGKQGNITEQRYLAERIKRISDLFIYKLEQVADLIRSTDSNDRAGLKRIAQMQESLLYACLRMECALKPKSRLQRELMEWNRRLETGLGNEDMQQALIRKEMLISELNIRNQKFDHFKPAAPSAVEIPIPFIEVQSVAGDIGSPPDAVVSMAQAKAVESGYLDHKTEDVIRNINHLLHEINEIELSDAQNRELLDKVHNLKDHCLQLKNKDRQNSARRNRLALTERIQRLFSLN